MIRYLVFWNGMTAHQVSGGDIYIKKFIELGKAKIDVALSGDAITILDQKKANQIYIIDNKVANSELGIVWLYLVRAIKSIKFYRAQRLQCDSVISASPFICDVLPACFVKSNSRTVIFFHLIPKRQSSNLSTRIRFFLARLEQKISLLFIGRYFDVILAGNEELKQQLKAKYPDKDIYIAHAGIDTSKIDLVRVGKKDPNLAVFVGRLTVQKGILDLVDIAEEIQKHHADFKLVIIGDGPDKDQLISKIKQRGLKSIELKGFVPEAEKYKILKTANFFLFPSYEEGWGIALAEALYSGCLCLCYKLEHYKGIFSDYPVYVSLGDKHQMATKILTNYNSAPEKGQVKYVSKYSDDLIISDLMREMGQKT